MKNSQNFPELFKRKSKYANIFKHWELKKGLRKSFFLGKQERAIYANFSNKGKGK